MLRINLFTCTRGKFMGLYDRDYGRDYGEATPWDQHQQAQKPKSITIILIVITVAVFLIGMFMPNRGMMR